MPVEVIMPKVDMDMAKGRIMAWHVAEGDTVAKGDPLFDIETDKAAFEVEASDAGTVHHLAATETDIAIGTAVAWLYAEGETVGDPSATVQSAAVPEPEEREPSVEAEKPAEPPAPAAPTPDTEKTRATPRARALAREGGLEIAALAGTGPRGRVQAEDVRATIDHAPNAATAAPTSFVPDTGALAITRKEGEGTPLVLIHGFAGDATAWAPLEAHLKGRALIRIDLPSHGKSPKQRIGGFPALVKEVRHAFDALNLEQAHVVGHSLGGAVALALADTRPRKVASLTALAPAGLGPQIDGAALGGICNATRPESLAPWLRTLVVDETLITDAYTRIAFAPRNDPALRAAQAAMADALFPDGVQAFDLRAALQRLEVPARIIWGKRDRIIPWQHALQAPGRVSLHLFEDVGHLPQIEITAEVGKILQSSL